MTIAYLPTATEHAWTERAAAHLLPDDLTQPAARWERGVTDLDTARVMLALERGAPITARGNGRWYAPSGSPLNAQSLSITVQELIRTGVVVHHPSGVLVPAWVHLRPVQCGEPGVGMGPKRVRAYEVLDPMIVDCPRCLDRL